MKEKLLLRFFSFIQAMRWPLQSTTTVNGLSYGHSQLLRNTPSNKRHQQCSDLPVVLDALSPHDRLVTKWVGTFPQSYACALWTTPPINNLANAKKILQSFACVRHIITQNLSRVGAAYAIVRQSTCVNKNTVVPWLANPHHIFTPSTSAIAKRKPQQTCFLVHSRDKRQEAPKN